MFQEYYSHKCNTYFANVDRLSAASNEDSFLFSKQLQDLANELLDAVPKVIEESSENIIYEANRTKREATRLTQTVL